MTSPKNIAERARVEETIWRATATEADPHYILTWNMPRFLIPVTRLRELLDVNGFGHIATPEVRGIAAITRALAEMTSDGEVRQVYSDEEEVAFAQLNIVQGDKDAKQAGLRQGATVSYLKHPAKGQPAIAYSSYAAEAQLSPIVQRYMDSYTNEDVAEKVWAPMLKGLAALSFRERGGVYLVPAGATDTVKRWRALVKAIGAEVGVSCHLSTIAIVNTDPEEKEAFEEDFRFHGHQALVSDLRNLASRAKEMLSSNRTTEEGLSSVKGATIGRYLEECDALGKRATLYRDVASLGLSEVNTALSELRGAYDGLRTGMHVSAFPDALQRVQAAVAAAERVEAHPVLSEADAADPFAADAALVGEERSSSRGDSSREGATEEEPALTDPFAADAAEL